MSLVVYLILSMLRHIWENIYTGCAEEAEDLFNFHFIKNLLLILEEYGKEMKVEDALEDLLELIKEVDEEIVTEMAANQTVYYSKLKVLDPCTNDITNNGEDSGDSLTKNFSEIMKTINEEMCKMGKKQKTLYFEELEEKVQKAKIFEDNRQNCGQKTNESCRAARPNDIYEKD